MAWDGLISSFFITRKRPLGFSLLLIALSILCQHSAAKVIDDELKNLNREFAEVSDAYYRDAAKSLAGTLYIKKDLKSLRAHLSKLNKSGDAALANAMLLANFPMVLEKIGSKSTPIFLQQLLEHDIWSSAEQLAKRALDVGSSFTSSRVNYLLGEYFFDRQDLDKTFKYLSAIESSEALTPKQRDYATIMFGISLQKLKRHREALKIYERIEAESYYYAYAQLNAAVAFIRQGWWTDAHISIEKALKSAQPKSLREVTNRLFVVLAYSQLQNEFYRNARETFRKVNIDSGYANRALLGIGLCALSQKDFPGAINAFTRLQNSEDLELPVFESHLMVPYTHNLMENLDAASQGYSEAITFYEVKLRELELETLSARQTNASLSKEQMNTLPKLILQKYRSLQSFHREQASPSVQKKITSLENAYRARISKELSKIAGEKVDHIKSYISQAQYGLAKLYDNQ